jgi:hypothetical protein
MMLRSLVPPATQVRPLASSLPWPANAERFGGRSDFGLADFPAHHYAIVIISNEGRMRQPISSACLGVLLAVGCMQQATDIEGDEPGECSDDADNDRDGKFDCHDPDCSGARACVEAPPEPEPAQMAPRANTEAKRQQTASRKPKREPVVLNEGTKARRERAKGRKEEGKFKSTKSGKSRSTEPGCERTRVNTLGNRIAGRPGTGTTVNFSNGLFLTSYSDVPSANALRKGDPVTVCLISTPPDCPPGDDRGKVYEVRFIGGTFQMPNSSHTPLGCRPPI